MKELDSNNGVVVRLSSTDQSTVDQWVSESREAVLLDLEKPETFFGMLWRVRTAYSC